MLPARPFLIVALIGLMPLAAVFGASPPAVEISASIQGGAFDVDVSAPDGATRVNLVVTHEDPLAGIVVDRVVPLNLTSATTEVSLADLRANVNVSVRVIEVEVNVPTFSNSTLLPDGAQLKGLPYLGAVVSVHLPALAPGAAHRYHANIVRDGGPWGTMGIAARASGALVFASVEPDPASKGGDVTVRVSRDGGHSWGKSFASLATWDGYANWAWDEASDGPITLAHPRLSWENGSFNVVGFDYARLDPEGERIVSEGSLFNGSARAVSLARLPDGSDALAVQSDSGPIRLFVLYPDGHIEPRGSVITGGNYSDRLDARLASSSTGTLALLWTENGTLEAARSLDGGRTFATPLALPTLGALSLRDVTRAWVGVDDTVQWLVSRWADGGNAREYHVRWPLSGSAVVTPLNGKGMAAPGSVNPVVAGFAVAGLRAWAFFVTTGVGGGGWAAESIDGGLTFGAPFRTEGTDGGNFWSATDAAVFPDGRPVVLGGYSGESGTGEAVIPLFDPLADVASGLVTITTQPPPAETTAGTIQPSASGPPGAPSVSASAPASTFTPTPSGQLVPSLGAGARSKAVARGSNNTTTEPSSSAPPRGTAKESVPLLPVVEGAIAAGGVILVAAVVSTEAGRYAVGLAGAAFYSRLQKRDILKNEVRAGVYSYVRDHPGIRYENLRIALGLSNGALAHHLRTLQRGGFVRARHEWTRRRYYATGTAPGPSVTSAPDTIVSMLGEEPDGLTASEIARRLGASRQLARYHLMALVRSGGICALDSGRRRRYRVASVPGARVTFRVVE